MITLRFTGYRVPYGSTPQVEVIVDGKAVLITTLARAMQYTARGRSR